MRRDRRKIAAAAAPTLYRPPADVRALGGLHLRECVKFNALVETGAPQVGEVIAEGAAGGVTLDRPLGLAGRLRSVGGEAVGPIWSAPISAILGFRVQRLVNLLPPPGEQRLARA
ncbi:hypothetical protein BAL199_30547 [alpha proteobacterium BAL199]|nr:hypothetical protein BAL199_30547 [alpha proteobacterium BAL199]